MNKEEIAQILHDHSISLQLHFHRSKRVIPEIEFENIASEIAYKNKFSLRDWWIKKLENLAL